MQVAEKKDVGKDFSHLSEKMDHHKTPFLFDDFIPMCNNRNLKIC